jgi:hypothetical protein
MHGKSNCAIPKSLSEPTLHLLRTQAGLHVKRAWHWLIVQRDLADSAGQCHPRLGDEVASEENRFEEDQDGE